MRVDLEFGFLAIGHFLMRRQVAASLRKASCWGRRWYLRIL